MAEQVALRLAAPCDPQERELQEDPRAKIFKVRQETVHADLHRAVRPATEIEYVLQAVRLTYTLPPVRETTHRGAEHAENEAANRMADSAQDSAWNKRRSRLAYADGRAATSDHDGVRARTIPGRRAADSFR
jgi:hypothetical protein